jgi:NAD(P)H-flavin reductase/ferredoxin
LRSQAADSGDNENRILEHASRDAGVPEILILKSGVKAMTQCHNVIFDDQSFVAQPGELLLDAALKNGIDLPFQCRAGHCGTCCVSVVSGETLGGASVEPGIVHACQCRVVADVVIESKRPASVRTVNGVVRSLRPLSDEVMEIGIKTEEALPHHAGQYVQARFKGFPSRPYSLTYPVWGDQDGCFAWFHIRRMKNGRVSSEMGNRIGRGHKVDLSGPYGSAHFRAGLDGRLILVATNTGFAPIWAIAIASLRERHDRQMMIVVGGRSKESLYMALAFRRLLRFPNVLIVPVCSSAEPLPSGILPGRPTNYLPNLVPSDVVYACGAPGMVEAVTSVAQQSGATCYADPFLPTPDDAVGPGGLTSVMRRFRGPAGRSRLLLSNIRLRDRPTDYAPALR